MHEIKHMRFKCLHIYNNQYYCSNIFQYICSNDVLIKLYAMSRRSRDVVYSKKKRKKTISKVGVINIRVNPILWVKGGYC